MLPTFILTKNFPSVKHTIKKSKKTSNQSSKEKKPNKFVLICQPEKCLQLVSHYSFPGGILVFDHLTVSKQNGYIGYYKCLNETKKITSLSFNEEFKMLEINMEDRNLEMTPFEFFEARMKSLGDKDSFEFCQTVKKILGFFKKGAEMESSLKKSKDMDSVERYKTFKKIIKERLKKLVKNNEFFIIFFVKSEGDIPNKIQASHHYISETLLDKIYLNPSEHFFDILKEGIPDFYGFGSNYYKNLNNVFKTMFLNEPNKNIDVVIKDANECLWKGKVVCENFKFEGEEYREYVTIQRLLLKEDSKRKQPSNSFKKFNLEQIQELKILCDQSSTQTNSPIPDTSKLVCDAPTLEFMNKFYMKKLPLNQMKENEGRVCGYRSITEEVIPKMEKGCL